MLQKHFTITYDPYKMLVGVIVMKITELKILDEAYVDSLKEIEPSFRRRLMDLGIYEGAHVILLNKLSFGSLYLIEVDEIEICLRKEDALLIEVSK